VPGDDRIAVVGAGSWGTAFAAIPAEQGTQTTLWARRPELAEAIAATGENPDYLPGHRLPESLRATADLAAAVEEATVVVMAVPSHTMREIFRGVAPLLGPDVPVISLSKGLEQGSLKRMTEVLREEGDLPEDRVAALTGPNLAKEIAQRMPAASVVACVDEGRGARLQDVFMAPTFRVYTNTDLIGCELGGALKNVMAIAAGMAEGMGFGDNTKASLMTRGLAELARLGVAMGGDPLTFQGLAGMGDLIATCSSKLSRNHQVGLQLAKGRSLEEIVADMRMVAEGVKTSRAVVDLGRRVGVEVPIAEMVTRVLYEGVTPSDAVLRLMLRSAKPELHGLDRSGPR
jgi:glycerol-3-phosphate dehydrogenase (NAD(P)+)